MSNRTRLLRGTLAAPLAALMVVLSVAVPMLDRGDLSDAPVVESEHDPGRCAPTHDHTICTQAGANLATPAPAPARFQPSVIAVVTAPTPALSTRSAVLLGPSSRAPPTA